MSNGGVRAADVCRKAIQSAQILFLSDNSAQGVYGSVGAVGPMATTDGAGGKMVYYIKECPVDPAVRKGQKWNKISWGSKFKEDAIPRFKEHLYKKHHIVGPSADKICADSK